MSGELVPHQEDLLPLPYGKEYHLFVSYSSTDETYVEKLVHELETTFKYKCLDHRRDFLPGESTLRNIENGFERSMKILLILSKNYLQSTWCKYETAMAHVLSTESNRNCIIPLLIDDIGKEELPKFLQWITYIDGRTENILNKIDSSFRYNATDSWLVLPNIITGTDKQNGFVYFEHPSRKSIPWCNGFLGLQWRFDDISDQMLNDLGDAQEIVKYSISSLLNELNSTRFLSTFHRFNRWKRSFIYTAIPINFICALFLIVCVNILYSNDIDTAFLVWRFVVGGAIWSVLCAIVCVIGMSCLDLNPLELYSKETRVKLKVTNQEEKLKHIIWSYWKEHLSHTSCLVLYKSPFISAENEPKLVFMHYNLSNCKKFLKEVLKAKDETEDDYALEEKANKLVEDFILFESHAIAKWTVLPTFNNNRHNTRNQRKCVCQMIEPEIM